MKYVAIASILDGTPDLQGDVVGDDVTLPKTAVDVSQDFNETLPMLGKAVVRKEDDKIIAYLDIDLIPDIAKQFSAAVGGKIVKRDGKVISKWILGHIALTAYPTDRRIGKLREAEDSEWPVNFERKKTRKKKS